MTNVVAKGNTNNSQGENYKLVFATEENRFQKIVSADHKMGTRKRSKSSSSASETSTSDTESTSDGGEDPHGETSGDVRRQHHGEEPLGSPLITTKGRPIGATEIIKSLKEVPPMPPLVSDSTPDTWFFDFQRTSRLEMSTKKEVKDSEQAVATLSPTTTANTADSNDKKTSGKRLGFGSLFTNALGKLGASLEKAAMESHQKAEMEIRRRHNKAAVQRLEKYFSVGDESPPGFGVKREDTSETIGAIIGAPYTFKGEDFVCCFNATVLSSPARVPVAGHLYLTDGTLYFVEKGSLPAAAKTDKKKPTKDSGARNHHHLISAVPVASASVPVFHDASLHRLQGGTRATQPDAEESDLISVNLLHLLPLPLHSGQRSPSDASTNTILVTTKSKHQDPNSPKLEDLATTTAPRVSFIIPEMISEAIPLRQVVSYSLEKEVMVSASPCEYLHLFVLDGPLQRDDAICDSPKIRKLTFMDFRHELSNLNKGSAGHLADGRPEVGYAERFVNFLDHSWRRHSELK